MNEDLENMKHVKNKTKEFRYGWQIFYLRERRLRIKKSGARPQRAFLVLPAYTLGQWFPKDGPRPENLLEMGIPWAPPQTYFIRDSRGGSSNVGVNKPFSWRHWSLSA